MSVTAAAAPGVAAAATGAARRPEPSSVIAWGGLALFAACLAMIGPAHEPWFDEAQAWLLARDADPWTIVAQLARYEGTPALWHLILWVAQRLGLPYGGFWLVSGSLALAGAAMVLLAAPLPLAVRSSFVFSYVFVYQYAVIARSYAIDLALAPAAAILFSRRLSRPLAYAAVLGLLANSNAFGWALASVLAGEAVLAGFAAPSGGRGVRARRALALGIFVMAAGGAGLQAWPILPKDARICCGVAPDVLRPIVLFAEGVSDPGLFAFAGPAVANVAAILVCAAVIASLAPLWAAAGRASLAAGLLGVLAVLMAVVGHFVHAGFIPLTLLFLLWISWDALDRLGATARRALAMALSLMLGAGDIDAVAAVMADLRDPYSASRAAAPVVLAAHRLYPERKIAALGLKTFALQPYLPLGVFANAAPDRRYWVWRRDFGVPTRTSPVELERLEHEGRYDLIVVSDDAEAPEPPATIARAGYCLLRTFPGAMIWKTRRLQPDGLMLLGRCREDWSALSLTRAG